MKNKKHIWAVGIDPGTKTGFSIWNICQQKLKHVGTYGILEAIERSRCLIEPNNENYIIFRIENPNLRKWYGKNSNSKLQGAGSIKRDYAIWEEFFEYYDLTYEEVNPKNIKTKVSSSYFKQLTGWEGRTTEHSRDAAMMVYKYK